MKVKIVSFIAGTALMGILLSSCTKENVNINGTWQSADNPTEIIMFDNTGKIAQLDKYGDEEGLYGRYKTEGKTIDISVKSPAMTDGSGTYISKNELKLNLSGNKEVVLYRVRPVVNPDNLFVGIWESKTHKNDTITFTKNKYKLTNNWADPPINIEGNYKLESNSTTTIKYVHGLVAVLKIIENQLQFNSACYYKLAEYKKVTD